MSLAGKWDGSEGHQVPMLNSNCNRAKPAKQVAARSGAT